MTAYCFWNVREVHDPAAMADYVARVTTTVRQYGGRYLVVGGPWHSVEGDWRPTSPVLIGFDSMAEARAWYDSPEYAALKAQRLRATSGDAIFMDSSGAEEHLARVSPNRTDASRADTSRADTSRADTGLADTAPAQPS